LHIVVVPLRVELRTSTLSV